MKATVIAVQSPGATLGSGFGLVCVQGQGRAEIAYDFLLLKASATTVRWVIERRDGAVTKRHRTTLLSHGSSRVRLGPKQLTVDRALLDAVG